MRTFRWIAAAAALTLACNDEKTGSGISMYLDTDMQVPDSIDEVGLYIQHVSDGQSELVVSQEAKPILDSNGHYTVRFAATFSVQAGDHASDQIRTRFVGYHKDGSVAAMREARTLVPTDGIRQLRLPLLFVNEGRVEDTQPGVATTGAGLELAQVQEGSRPDPFTRFRHPECQADQTLGDDGTCTSIDVELDPNANYAGTGECLDTKACFGGVRAVRQLDLGANCMVSTLGLEADALALALPVSHGFDGGEAGTVQPVDSVLYSYDAGAHVLALKPALCARAQKDGITKVWISAKCDPKDVLTPICAPWRNDNEQTPKKVDGTASFPDDPPPPDTGVPETGSDAADDAADSNDAADSGPAAEAFHRIVTIDNDFSGLSSFAMHPDGRMWLQLQSEGSLTVKVGAGTNDEGVLAVAVEPPDAYDGTLTLAPNGAVYLLPDGYSQVWALPEDSSAYAPVGFGPGCTGASPSYFTVGAVGNDTVALYGGSSGMPAVSGGKVKDGDPLCFPKIDQVATTDYPSNVYRGALSNGKFRVPYDTSKLLTFDVGADLGGVDAVPSIMPDGTNTLILQSLVSIGTGTVLAGKVYLGESYDEYFYELTYPNDLPQLAATPIGSLASKLALREIYGGPDVFCARIVDSSDHVYQGVECYRRAGGAFQPFSVGHSVNYEDLHIYGDSTYLYVSRLCYDLASARYASLKVQATPWSQVDQHAADSLFDGSCHDYVQVN